MKTMKINLDKNLDIIKVSSLLANVAMKRAYHTRKQTILTVMMFYCREYSSKPTMIKILLSH